MIDNDKIEKYLDDLFIQLADLARLPVPDERYLTEPENFAQVKAIKYSLLVAIEDVIHIAAHLVAALGLGRPSVSSAADLLDILGKHKVIPEQFARRISGMANFRNRLVHEYLPGQLDTGRLYMILRQTDDFKTFAKYIVEFIEQHPGE